MIRFKQFISESIDLDTAKKWKLTRKESGAYKDKKLNKLFKGKDRYAIIDEFKPKILGSTEFVQIEEFLEKHGYSIDIDGYMNNYAYKIDFDEEGNYKGVNTKQKFRIGKLLQKLGTEEEIDKYKNDRSKDVKPNQNYKIILSRHPYDIAGMSTGRSWRSCMTIPTPNNTKAGDYCFFVKNDILEGTLIAYLVRDNDKNINKPLSRVLVKPMEGENGDIAYGVENIIYGAQSSNFIKEVRTWVADNLNTSLKSEEYYVYPTLYDDNLTTTDGKDVEMSKKDWAKLVIDKANIDENVEINFGEATIFFRISLSLPVEYGSVPPPVAISKTSLAGKGWDAIRTHTRLVLNYAIPIPSGEDLNKNPNEVPETPFSKADLEELLLHRLRYAGLVGFDVEEENAVMLLKLKDYAVEQVPFGSWNK